MPLHDLDLDSDLPADLLHETLGEPHSKPFNLDRKGLDRKGDGVFSDITFSGKTSSDRTVRCNLEAWQISSSDSLEDKEAPDFSDSSEDKEASPSEFISQIPTRKGIEGQEGTHISEESSWDPFPSIPI